MYPLPWEICHFVTAYFPLPLRLFPPCRCFSTAVTFATIKSTHPAQCRRSEYAHVCVWCSTPRIVLEATKPARTATTKAAIAENNVKRRSPFDGAMPRVDKRYRHGTKRQLLKKKHGENKQQSLENRERDSAVVSGCCWCRAEAADILNRLGTKNVLCRNNDQWLTGGEKSGERMGKIWDFVGLLGYSEETQNLLRTESVSLSSRGFRRTRISSSNQPPLTFFPPLEKTSFEHILPVNFRQNG